MAENRKSVGRIYYQLSGGQLFILGVVFVLTSGVIFFLGLFVGKTMDEQTMPGNEEPVVKIPVQPQQPGAVQDMTFYDTLTRNAPATITGEPGNGEPRPSGELEEKKSRRGWSIQVTAFQEKKDASRMVGELESQGYDAFVVSGKVKGKTWHRVRVGWYSDRSMANEALQRLRKSERYENAIVTRND